MKISFNIPASRATLAAALEGLTGTNFVLLSRAKRVPGIYMSGVRYQREPRGREVWQTFDQIIRAGVGDCEDLAAWRAAELRMAGIPARAVAVRTGPKMFHAVVRYPDGRIEDPSAKLGMRKPRRAR